MIIIIVKYSQIIKIIKHNFKDNKIEYVFHVFYQIKTHQINQNKLTIKIKERIIK